MEERHFGIIKTFDVFKGFGFIQRQKGQDVFFFYQEIEHDDKILVEGDKVSFFIEKAPKGWRALKIRKEA
ncbi:MAG: cold-shock protein [Methylobacter sp.]|nr:MAG: cold-shock protein [Methylobacter sp.]